MKLLLRLFAFLLICATIAPGRVQAQNPGGSFSCDGTFYQVRQTGTGTGASSVLYVVNRSTAAYTTAPYTFGGTNNTGNLGVVLNGLSYNSLDSYLYALTYPADNGTLNAANGVHLYRIGQGGIQDLGRTDLPLLAYNSGTIDKEGNFYVTTRASGVASDNILFRLNLANFSTVLTSHDEIPIRNSSNQSILDASTYLRDIAFSPSDDNLYGVGFINQAFRLQLNAARTQATVTILGTGNSGDVMGSNFFDVAGNLYAYSNGTIGTAGSGGFYSVSTADGAMTKISSIDPVSNSDGASCINPDQKIDVIKQVTNVSVSTSGGGPNLETRYDVTFEVGVKNTGTTTAPNVQVADFLATTFPSTSFSILTGSTVTNFGVNATAPPTLAFNTAFTGRDNNADLLTGNRSLTAGQSALIRFTVRLAYAVGAAPPTAPFFNSAYASTISGATANQGHVQLSNGSVLPPGNLLAEDKSNNSAGFPLTPNGDGASPTPVYLNTVISGSVFEDVNYGGGAGRNQFSSSGQGVEARVELYSGAGAFLRSTGTDAEGNYLFTNEAGTTPLAPSTDYRVRVVNSSVVSSRAVATTGLNPIAVQTFISNGTTPITNQVGGAIPTLIDFGATNSGNLPASTAARTIQSITNVRTPASGPVLGADFGFNFDLVVNTNDADQGSLRQFIINANALGNATLDQVAFNGTAAAGTTATTPAAGIETAIFMMNDGRANGTAPAGLRLGMTAPAGYNATTGFTITLATPLPDITDSRTAIDGEFQATLTGNRVAAIANTTTGPEVTINFNSLKGLFVTGGNTRIASLGLNNARGSVNGTNTTITLSDGAAVTFSGASVSGSTVSDVTATNNAVAGVRLQRSGTTAATNATGVTIANNILRTGTTITGTSPVNGAGINLIGANGNVINNNTISNNSGWGILLATASNDGNTIRNNTINNNGTGSTTEGAGIGIQVGNNNLISANTINANSSDGIVALNGTLGNRFSQNNIFANGGTTIGALGIDLSANTTVTGDGVTPNANGKTAASGANGLLNFPVFTQATIFNGMLFVTGYARAGALLELFVASADPTQYGEGATYLFNATEGSASDGDVGTANYSATSGLPAGSPTTPMQGSETGVSRFRFSFPVTAAQATSLVSSKLTATVTVPTTVNGLAVGNTSEFSALITVLNNQPLPVELTEFTVTAVKNLDAALVWRTATEKNNERFEVERSLNGVDFAAIGQVRGQGTKSSATDYALTDAGIGRKASGLVYYRLKQVDTDGTATFSPVRTVEFAKTLTISLFPNPATGTVQLDLGQLPTGAYQVSLIDAVGRTVLNQTLAAGIAHPLDLHSVVGGTYTLLVRGQNGGHVINFTKRLVKE